MAFLAYKDIKKYNKQWIALTKDYKKIAGNGNTIKQAIQKAQKNGVEKPVLFYVSPYFKTCVVWKFKYLKIQLEKPHPVIPSKKSILRPIISIELKYGEKSVDITALIDSGADNCLFSAEVGEYLGIKVKSGIRYDITGIRGESIETYYHKVTILIGGWPIDVWAGFLIFKNRKNQLSFGLLGQSPIFEKYRIIFNLRTEEIEFR